MRDMNSSRGDFVQATLALSVAASLPGTAGAQAFPAKPIRLICPCPAGGDTDAVTRALGESVGKILGGIVVVENK